MPSAKRPNRLWLLIAAGAVVAAVGAYAWAVRQSSAISYTTTPISRGPVVRAVTATGTVNPVLTIIVGSYVSGVIQDVSCDFNTVVKKGQVCAKIDPRPYQTVVGQAAANLGVARAQLAKDQASLVYAKLSYERNLTLAKREFVSQDTADNAKSVQDQAEAQVGLDVATIALHQAELDAAQVNLDYTNITSPVDGVVVSRNVTMGQTVASTFQTPTLFLIATDLTKMEVDTNVSESDVGVIKEGQTAHFTIDAYPGRIFTGVVGQRRQSPQTLQNVVTYDILVMVDNDDHALMPGMTAATQIISAQRDNVLRVDDAALRYVPGGTVKPVAGQQKQLWLLRDGKPISVTVALGLDDDSVTELVSGDIKPGDLAITGEQRDTGASLPTPRL